MMLLPRRLPVRPDDYCIYYRERRDGTVDVLCVDPSEKREMVSGVFVSTILISGLSVLVTLMLSIRDAYSAAFWVVVSCVLYVVIFPFMLISMALWLDQGEMRKSVVLRLGEDAGAAAMRAVCEREIHSRVTGGPIPTLERAIVRHVVMSDGGDPASAVLIMERIQKPLLEGRSWLTEDRRQALDDLCKDDQGATALVFATETVLQNRNTSMSDRFDRYVVDMVTKQRKLTRIAERQQYEFDNPDLSEVIEDVLEPVETRLRMELEEVESVEPAQTLNRTRHRRFIHASWLSRALTRMFS